QLRITGTVHDPGLAPAWQEQTGYAYITLETLRWLGESQGFDQLKIQVATDENSVPHITRQAKSVSAWLEKKGYSVHEIQVPPPNRHPHQGQMDAVMTIFIVFSYLILLLGSILVATSIATLMVKQVRQIGVMKTIGANSGQVARLYLAMMLVICVAAIVISIPLSQLAASLLYSRISTLLNLELTNTAVPAWVTLVQIGTGLTLPLLAVAVPIVRGSRLSVRNAIDSYGVAASSSVNMAWFARLSQIPLLSTTFRLSLRNVFRQRSRLAMTLGLLAAGGAMFMTAMNVSDAWDSNLRRIYTQRLYDLEIRLNQPIQADSLVNKLQNLPGVARVEVGNTAPVSLINDGPFEITHTYPDKGHGSFSIQALPLPVTLLSPSVVEGLCLNRPGANDIVLNQLARGRGSKPGDRITLSIDGKPTTWTIIGFTEDVGSPATAYVSADAFAAQTATTGRSTMLRIAFMDRNKANVKEKIRDVEALLERERVAVKSSIPVWLLHNAIAGHMKILINSLLAMALLMGIVGTLGLLSSMSMNVMERTRELGVMRAIGATPATIRRLIVWEGFSIGALSLLLAFFLSLLLSVFMGRFIGQLAFRMPLSLVISPLAAGSWIGIVALGSYLATVLPARRAAKLTTREALANE
ncbi:MAG: ABC transporter permease, partial [Cytophagaceae bacterium]